jgi:hypothetical protein
MNASNFDFKGGIVESWSLDDLNPKLDLVDQASFLTEDMALVTYDERVLLDVGWFGNGADGEFRVSVIENENWDTPIFKETAPDLVSLKRAIEKAVGAACLRRG